MQNENSKLELLYTKKDLHFQNGETYLSNKQYKEAIIELEQALSITQEIYEINQMVSVQDELFALSYILGKTYQENYLIEGNQDSLIKAIKYLDNLIKLLNNKSQNILNNIRNIIELSIKIGNLQLNNNIPFKNDYFNISLKWSKKLFKITKEFDDYYKYLLMLEINANSLYQNKKYHNAYKLLTSCEVGFNKLYRHIHTKECEEHIEKNYKLIIELCRINHWKRKKKKYENKLYSFNNYI